MRTSGGGGTHVGIDVPFVLDEVLLEHAHELAGGLVERRFVLPGLPAKALGLTTPLSLLGRADEVIE